MLQSLTGSSDISQELVQQWLLMSYCMQATGSLAT